ncbi:MAG: ribonuclease HI [Patescibacteria group bacterium]
MITIYTDGASRGNPGPGGWGAIILNDDRVVEIGGRENHTTNNRMELTGAIKALEFVPVSFADDCVLFTDSEYVMKGITAWIHRWQKKGWKTANKKPVLNQDLWQELLNVTKNVEKHLPAGRQVEWKYVAGHSGNRLNDRCDEIATNFADNIPLVLYNGSKDKYK